MEKILARGAEAVILKNGSLIVKNRIPKGYRHPELDEKLRKLRTRSEAKLLDKASKIINTPKMISADKYNLSLEYIKGKKLSEHLDKVDYKTICNQIGKSLAKLHDAGIIHGDLTTSNMIYNKKLYLIDFGLGFHSDRVEDKAVDLHLIKQALEAKHPKIYEKAFSNIVKGYKSSKSSAAVLKQLEKVESRGRYKEQY